ncbi:MAG: glycerophosphodiester phosphodiesterase family protein [Promethearchaeota archaeon]
MESKKVFVIAHRGANAEAPENTLKAFELAVDAGADFVEFDVHLSSDGELVVIHDFFVNRTTNGKGRVSRLTAAQLAALDAGEGQGVPTFEEVVEVCRGRVGLQVEIKGAGAAGVLARKVRELGVDPDRVLVSSFRHSELAELRRTDSELAVAPLVPTGLGWATDWLTSRLWPRRLVRVATRLGAVALHPFHKVLNENVVAEARNAGVRVHPWTIDDPARVRQLLDWGAGGVITNDPRSIRRVLEERSASVGAHEV